MTESYACILKKVFVIVDALVFLLLISFLTSFRIGSTQFQYQNTYAPSFILSDRLSLE